jgi:uncharacterized protein (TIGR03083 family)
VCDDPTRWLRAVRQSHDQLSTLTRGLEGPDLLRPSACSEWKVAQVLSHLGSQAEIFSLFVDAALEGADPPSRDAFPPVWDRWNAKPPAIQASDCLEANERLVSRLEGLDGSRLDDMRVEMFGQERDASGLLRMRLSEHALHTWDVAVAFDPNAEVTPDSVSLLVDGLPELASRAGRPAEKPVEVAVTLTTPDRRFRLLTGGVTLRPDDGGGADASLQLAAEGFLRLVYGRVSDAYPPRGPVHAVGVSLPDLEAVFPGF